jgi:DNA-binding transcriptional regulator YiaG
MSAMIAVRAALLAVAVAACAWFALGAHQAHDTQAATNLLDNSSQLSPTQARAVNSTLDSAATLNPDEEVNILRAEVAIDQGQFARARSMLARVIHREPKNLAAYIAALHASSNDQPAFYATLIAINRLAPGILSQH